MIRAWFISGVSAVLILSAVVFPRGASSPGTAAANASTGSTDFSVSVSHFRSPLSPYGRWVDYSGYGWCWSPYVSDADWRPYSDGYWVYSDFGWTWVSNEPWGWATYHYGRWAYDSYYGWLWVPDTVWAPAWVAWRSDDYWVGWAPLPPDAMWRASVGLQFASFDRIPARQWCFVQRDRLVDHNLSRAFAPANRVSALLVSTRNNTRFEIASGRPINRGPAVEVFERHMAHPISRVHVRDVDNPERGRGQSWGDGTVGFYRPTQGDRGPRQPARVPERMPAVRERVPSRWNHGDSRLSPTAMSEQFQPRRTPVGRNRNPEDHTGRTRGGHDE